MYRPVPSLVLSRHATHEVSSILEVLLIFPLSSWWDVIAVSPEKASQQAGDPWKKSDRRNIANLSRLKGVPSHVGMPLIVACPYIPSGGAPSNHATSNWGKDTWGRLTDVEELT